MKRIFLLSGENLELSRAEVLALARSRRKKGPALVENLLILDADFDFKRLSLTHKVYDYLFECLPEELDTWMANYDWNRIYDKSFSLRITNLGDLDFFEKEAQLARFIWHKVQSPRVDLDFSQTPIEVIVTDRKIYVGKLICESKHAFHKRRPSTHPARHPTTINPKLARALVNLSGVPTGKTVVDPFCGSGGILIEAGLMRFKTLGYDIDPKMIDRAFRNLSYFKIKRFHLATADATRLSDELDYVVTDLPYGRSSRVNHELTKLYSKFISNLEKILKYKAVVVFPDFFDHHDLLEDSSLKIEKEFSWYVHRSLSRNIVLLSMKKKG